MEYIVYRGSVKDNRLGIRATEHGDDLELEIVSPCCGQSVFYKDSMKSVCNGCGREYSGYTDNKHTIKDGEEAWANNWVKAWLKLEDEDFHLKITWRD